MSQLGYLVGDQAVRLATLERYEIFYTASEPSFDDIVGLAMAVCGTPMAFIGFFDAERIWLKAQVGLTVSEIPLQHASCLRAFATTSLVVVPDLRAASSNRLGAAANLDFGMYAGVSLRAPEGDLLGTLSVVDRHARPDGLTLAQIEGLQALARQTMLLLDARRRSSGRRSAGPPELSRARAELSFVQPPDTTGGWLHELRVRALAAQEAGGIGTFEVDLASGETWVSGIFCGIYGLPVADLYPTSVIDALVVRDGNAGAFGNPQRDGTRDGRVVTDFRIRRAGDHAVRWLAQRAEYIRDGTGTATRLIGTVLDNTERKLLDLRHQMLLEFGDSARGASTVAEIVAAASRSLGETLGVARAGYAVVDTSSGMVCVEGDWVATGVASIAGHHPAALFPVTFERAAQADALGVDEVATTEWLGADRQSYAELGVGAFVVTRMYAREERMGVLFLHNATPRNWSNEETEFARSVTERAYAYIAKLKAEEDQRLLNQELSHRLKNTLAMVQAIATQTLKALPERSIVDTFNQRLLALGTAHDILLQNSWAAARIRAVADGVLSLHTDLRRFEIDGVDFSLGSKAVLSLSMLLHELGTNALKYGALSNDSGKVVLEWAVDYSSDQATFFMTWREVGGPKVQAPADKGFGSRLMRVGLAGTGNSILSYDESGVVAEFRAPLSLLTVT